MIRFCTPFVVLCTLVMGSMLASCGEGDQPGSSSTSQNQASPSQDRIDASLAAAEQYFDNGENEKAETILATLLKRAPDQPRAHELLASIEIARADACAQRGDGEGAKEAFAQAYDHYEIVIEGSPPNAGLEQSAGRVAIAAGETDAALAHFRRAGDIDSADPSNPLLEANLLLQLKRLDEARAAIDRAVKLDGEEPYALATLAMVLHAQGEAELALQKIAEARELARPNDELAIRVVEARLHRLLGDPERALALLLPLSGSQRAEQAVASEIAESAVANGDHKRAFDAWAHRYQLTKDWNAALHAARQALAAGLVDESWSWFRRAELAAPSAPTVREFYAQLRAHGRDHTDDPRPGEGG